MNKKIYNVFYGLAIMSINNMIPLGSKEDLITIKCSTVSKSSNSLIVGIAKEIVALLSLEESNEFKMSCDVGGCQIVLEKIYISIKYAFSGH
ncbi:MAG: hypothetical protein M3Z01_01155 [Thermoproteota archaeon]|nr:hypothetical protein [Thermoproteota archaeon]